MFDYGLFFGFVKLRLTEIDFGIYYKNSKEIAMSGSDDKLNYVKNMIQMMCCDGVIDGREKKFLGRAAKEIGLQVDDWGRLVKEVIDGDAWLYPIEDRGRGIATLKSLVVMAKADGVIDAREKDAIVRFAKSMNVGNEEWNRIRKEIDVSHLFDAFKGGAAAVKAAEAAGGVGAGGVTVIREDFERIEEFRSVAKDNSIATRVVGLDEFISGAGGEGDFVCFHAAQDKNETVRRCKELLGRCGVRTVSILTRYQGHQVKYLHEIGLEKCVIEPVYEQDIVKVFG